MDTEASKTFLAPLYSRMYAVALAVLGNHDDAADAVQDAVMRLFEMCRRLGEGGQVAHPESFAIFVVRNYAIDRLRELSRHRMRSLDDSGEIAVDGDNSDAVDDFERVRTMMDSLTVNQRKVLEMTAIGGMDAREVAGELNLTENNVRQLLSRARKQLRRLFYKD